MSRWLPPTQYSIRFKDSPVHIKATVIQHRHLPPGDLARSAATTFASGGSSSRAGSCTPATGPPARPSSPVSSRPTPRPGSGRVPWLPSGLRRRRLRAATRWRVSMSWEVRPEPPGRAEALWEAQKEEQVPVFRGPPHPSSPPVGRSSPAPTAGRGLWSPARPVDRAETLPAEALLPPLDRPVHDPLVEARPELRRLARVHSAQGPTATGGSRSSSPSGSGGGP